MREEIYDTRDISVLQALALGSLILQAGMWLPLNSGKVIRRDDKGLFTEIKTENGEWKSVRPHDEILSMRDFLLLQGDGARELWKLLHGVYTA